ncbi:MAG: lysophospholipid acyltransferase family protein [Gammaproteobacteria bacterium]
MSWIRCLFRLGLLVAHIVAGLLICVFYLRAVDSPRGAARTPIVGWWFRRLCHIAGLKITAHGRIPGGTALIVANHVSWLDIPILGGLVRTRFVSKIEIGKWPIVGRLVRSVGTLFIRRGGKNAAAAAAEQMTWHLRRGNSIAMFPEGTTTDGSTVKRFHPRLFAAALLANTPVQPVAIRYPRAGRVHPAAPFIDEMNFVYHALGVLRQKSMDVEITFCPPLKPSDHSDRRVLAEQAHKRIKDVVCSQQAAAVNQTAGS